MSFRFKNELEPKNRRTFKYKNPKTQFFCPLCSTPRAFSTTPRLTTLNYFQSIAVSAVFINFLFPLMQFRSLFIVLVVWMAFVFGKRAKFRKEIPCPHCGFDASWYKRDVKVARRLVKEFWQLQDHEEPPVDIDAIDNEMVQQNLNEPQSETPYFG